MLLVSYSNIFFLISHFVKFIALVYNFCFALCNYTWGMCNILRRKTLCNAGSFQMTLLHLSWL